MPPCTAFVSVSKEGISDQAYSRHWHAFLYVRYHNSGCISQYTYPLIESRVQKKITKSEDVTQTDSICRIIVHQGSEKKHTFGAPTWVTYVCVLAHGMDIEKEKPPHYNKIRYNTAKQTNQPTRNSRKLQRLSERDLELSGSLALCVGFS